MRRTPLFSIFLFLAMGLSACDSDTNAPTPACGDGRDNDSDQLIDFPNDPGCTSLTDTSEEDPATPPACSDGVDNDNDGLVDLADPGCGGVGDNSEVDPPTGPACSDEIDNDSDGRTDYPNDPGCFSAGDTDETDPSPSPECSDGLDNDGDTRVDYPEDQGCDSAADNSEAGPTGPVACQDNFDNDGDGLTDYPDDPGCASPADADETDPPTLPACADGMDNDSDGLTDHPNDPGCTDAADDDETDPVAPPACSDGADNDSDGLTDFPADPGCAGAGDDDESNPPPLPLRHRYSMANGCWALIGNAAGNYVVRTDNGYAATAIDIANAEPFFLKPSALGKYLLHDSMGELMTVNGLPTVARTSRAGATDSAEWTVRAVGDMSAYPPTPAYNVEPTAEQVATYRAFVDPNVMSSTFTLFSAQDGANLSMDAMGAIQAVVPGSNPSAESFSFVPHTGCKAYPEAQSNFTGTPFSGTQSDGTVLGHADVHVHISSSEFLGGAQWGRTYHKFGVEHALGDCAVDHGDTGQEDLVGGLFTMDPDGHATDGYPTFTEWPARNMLTHEAIYWKWLERSWASGLRVVVNDLVDNETLCELQRNAKQDPTRDCNSMNNAGQQAGTMYGMQDYIDAQYGDRGAGFFQIVHSADEAREVIEDGKMAVVLGIEISELFDCKLKYNPLRMERPFEETGSGGIENSYTCTQESLVEQMDRAWGWGVRQLITIHEFDNAFGGNGIFDGLILNMGNREDTGGIPSGDLATLVSLIDPDFNPDLLQQFVENLPSSETPTGEWWTTYDCPIEGGPDATPGFSGYLWEGAGGSAQEFLSPPMCVFAGQEGRPGGPTPCYPMGVRQCNARWMTPIGLFMYGKLMEKGFIIDWDHMEIGMKTQLLELAEAQDPAYPIVSTHGTFGGVTIDQTMRQLRNGGYVYPSNGSSSGFRNNLAETLGIYDSAMAGIPEEDRPLFGFGYGTDTNGLSAQTGPRGSPANPIVYPFVLFDGGVFDEIPAMFGSAPGVTFHQPNSLDANGVEQRTWHQDVDGNAHHGMLSDFVQEIRLDGSQSDIRHLFNSAEVYLQTWKRTEDASAAVRANGLAPAPEGTLRPAPIGEQFDADEHFK